MSSQGFHDMDEGDGGAPKQERKHSRYQLYVMPGKPCQWFLSVDGEERRAISSHDLNVQSRWRNWHLDNGYRPPETEKNVNRFEEMIVELFDAAIKLEVDAPFLQTDAEHVETMRAYLQSAIGPLMWQYGEEFAAGKAGDWARLRMDQGRIYFKWEPLDSWLKRALHMRGAELKALKVFIMTKGGYQPKTGIKGWFRCTYWLPWDLFDEQTKEKWSNGGRVQEEE
jgi:hypothetical protein